MKRSATLQLWSERLTTPIGVLVLLRDDDDRLRALEWADLPARMDRALRLHYGADGFSVRAAAGAGASGVALCLQRYFAGDLTAIDDVAVATGGTPFQRRVWQVLRMIPAGTTITYAELARRIGQPTAFRAVGHANGANPISIVVPCHRVIGSDASLTGYGGGTTRKRWLLAHEGFAGLPA